MMIINRIIRKVKRKTDISVIIPFNNVEDYFDECLKSVINQKGVSLEIILIDDGSTDNSYDIARKYSDKMDSISIYRIDQSGPGHARNYGVQFAKGEFISFVDADDILVKGIYKRMIQAARNNDAEVCICNAARFNSKRKWASDLHDKVYKDYSICTNIRDNPRLIYDSCVWNKLIRRKFYTQCSLEWPEGIYYEDIPFNADIHLNCNKVVMIAETGYLWRDRAEDENASITQRYYEKKNIDDRFTVAKSLIERFADDSFDDALTQTVKLKILEWDLKIILDSVNYISMEESLSLFDRVNKFIDRNIGSDVIEMLPIVDIQRYDLVKKMDVDGYKKLLVYRSDCYNKAQITEKEGHLYATLPGDIIKTENRIVDNEFARKTRRIWIDEVIIEDNDIEICAHCYTFRINYSNPTDQEIRVLLINEETNDIIEVPSEAIKTGFLTDRYGIEYDEATGIESSYNYDYTGFRFRIREAIIDTHLMMKKTKYSVLVEYKDRLFNGNQILKGIRTDDIKKCASVAIKGEDRIIRVGFGAQKELQIIVSKQS